MEAANKAHVPNPRATANPISVLFFWWMKNIFITGNKRDLEVSDIYDILPGDESDKLGDELEKNWIKELEDAKKMSRKPELQKALTRTFLFKELSILILPALINLVTRVLQPVLLSLVIQYFNPESSMTKNGAYVYAVALIINSFINMSMSHHHFLATTRIGMQIRVSLCSLMYRKVLKLSKASLAQTAAGQMVNLMSNDVNRFDFLLEFINHVLFMPAQAVIITYIIWQFVGVSALIGVAGLFLQSVPVQSYMGKLSSKFRQKIAVLTDDRVKLMSEIINGIQVIKMYAWEKPFEKLVSLARRKEVKIIGYASNLKAVNMAFKVFAERTSLFITVISYALLGNTITPEKVFALAQFFNILQLSMAIYYPLALQFGAEAKVSVLRLQTFLLLDECSAAKPIQNGGISDDIKKSAKLELKNFKAKWSPQLISNTLNGISMSVKEGELCAVVGPVGSGKSTLLQAILGEVPITEGSLIVSGKVSYASQEPWLFVGTVRQNILFGELYDSVRYHQVVKVCALERDFELFPHGDKTMVGERGVSLSGGQRARINLARAVYQNADIYILDDPLSAVDTHVGRQLFDQCIKSYLSGKIRILVTHQLQYLQAADKIIVLNNGNIESDGSYRELLKNNSIMSSLLQTEDDNEKQMADKSEALLSRQLSINSNGSNVENEEEEPEETTEMIAKGQMKRSLFIEYFRSGSNWCLLSATFFILVLGQIACSGADFWVTYWTNQEEQRVHLEHVLKNLQDEKSFITNDTVGRIDTENSSSITSLDIISEFNNTSPESILLNSYNSTINETEATLSAMFSKEQCIYIYTFCIVCTIIITTIRSVLFFAVCMRSSKGLHDNMFNSILKGTMRFFDTNPSGRVLNRFSKDMGAIDELLPFAILEAFQIVLVMSGILFMVNFSNYYLIIPTIIVGIWFLKLRSIYMSTLQSVKRLEGTTRSPVFSHLTASLNGLLTIRAGNKQELLKQQFDEHQDLHSTTWCLIRNCNTAFGYWLDISSTVFVGIITLSFLFLDDGTMGGFVGLAISQSLILTGMLQYGMKVASEAEGHMISVERVMQYKDIEKEPPFESTADKKPSPEWPSYGEIKFIKTSLRYSLAEPPVLKDLEFNVTPGHKVGIVGRTGAGKSSLISALFRLAKLDGSIYIDGIDTQAVGLHDLRSRISIIPQEPVLFSASLRFNLDPFNEYPDFKLWEVLEEVELKDNVDNLAFQVNEGGSNFSVGQRQLICLARAILRSSKILVLDEATANVDQQTDALIQSTIRQKFKECTVLTIAHRINTIMDSDKVLVMDAGEVMEYDHPHNLLQNCDGIFYKMVQETGKSMSKQLMNMAAEAFEQQNKEVSDHEVDAAKT